MAEGQPTTSGAPAGPVEERIAIQCKADAVKPVVALLNALANGKKDQHAFVTVNETGIRFAVENQAKSLHGVAYLKEDLFRTYEFHELDGCNEYRFKVNLAILLECLNVFGGPSLPVTSLILMYSPDSGCLRLLLEESGVLTECSITTVEAGEELDFPSVFRRYPALSRALLKSAHLKEAFAELGDLPGAANIEVTMAPAYPYFRLAAAGSGGSCAVDFPQGSESFISFESSSAQTYRFHASLLQCAVKALTSAEETFLRLNDQGMLCVNHKIVNADSKVMYVSFIVLPDLPEDDEHTDAQSRPSTYNRTNTTGTSGGIDTTTE